MTAHWGIPDPAAAEPDRRDRAFRDAFYALQRRIQLFLSLPLCSWLYGKLEPVLGRFSKRQPAETAALASAGVHAPDLSFIDKLIAWSVITGGVMIGNLLSYKVPLLQSLTGMLAIIAVVLVVDTAKRLVPRMPMVLPGGSVVESKPSQDVSSRRAEPSGWTMKVMSSLENWA